MINLKTDKVTVDTSKGLIAFFFLGISFYSLHLSCLVHAGILVSVFDNL